MLASFGLGKPLLLSSGPHTCRRGSPTPSPSPGARASFVAMAIQSSTMQQTAEPPRVLHSEGTAMALGAERVSGAQATHALQSRQAVDRMQQQQPQQRHLGRSSSVLTSRMIAQATNVDLDELSSSAPAVTQRVAYQGVPGAFSEAAALKACPSWEALPCEQFEVAFQALSQWMADRAVLPIENSLGGSIHTVYDLLLRYRLHIVGEVSVEVNHCLMALPGVAKGDIRRVMSHPQALAQVDGYLRRMPGAAKEAVDDTAGAAQTIAKAGWRDAAAVASRRAAELYGLDVLDEGIQDMEDNITRFIVLSRDPLVTTEAAAGQDSKTSVVFSLHEGPGQLFKALSVFALRDMDMTKIESRPMRTNPIVAARGGGAGSAGISNGGRRYNYLFYVDFVGSLADAQAQNALRHLQEITPFLRVLGSFPMDPDFTRPPTV